ncbi:hypothetical protein KC19_VG199200 [Ceratodon purpureus]|uniref:Uncharacterized protein n=1 Tax=Ceratodon purpureus TaxID=3225 RepID=A0A8T0HRT1_CERPU|nr:hypothetical protein KC19_VG199200 [Ceratodon purpureus]
MAGMLSKLGSSSHWSVSENSSLVAPRHSHLYQLTHSLTHIHSHSHALAPTSDAYTYTIYQSYQFISITSLSLLHSSDWLPSGSLLVSLLVHIRFLFGFPFGFHCGSVWLWWILRGQKVEEW